MSHGILKPKPTLGEQFLAKIYSQSESQENEKFIRDFHAKVPYLKDTIRAQMTNIKKKTGHAHLQIFYYNCSHCDNIATLSCVKKHRHNVETFSKDEFEFLCEAYMQKQKSSNQKN